MDVQRSEASLPQLPDEVIEAILLRAPVETVLRFRFASAPWRALIGTKRFIAEHLKNSPAASSFIFNFTIEGLKHCDADSPFCMQFVESLLNRPRRLYDAVLLAVPVVHSVVGSIDGLVCYLDGSRVFRLWNPATRVITSLPALGGTQVLNPGFGFDESSGEFKVFAVEGNFRYETYERRVYSSRTNSWKLLETAGHGNIFSSSESGILVSGKLHWVRQIRSKRDIVSFDIKTEGFGEMKLPGHAEHWHYNSEHLTLGEFGGRLSSLTGHSGWEVDVWVMEEYGVSESWTKLVRLQPPLSLSAPYFTGPSGEILLLYASKFLVYYPNDKVFRVLACTSSFRGVHHCVKSLVTPDYALAD